MKYLIMRSPVLQEDAGRHFAIKLCDTEQAAKDWIEKQEGEYFGPSDYYISPVKD